MQPGRFGNDDKVERSGDLLPRRNAIVDWRAFRPLMTEIDQKQRDIGLALVSRTTRAVFSAVCYVLTMMMSANSSSEVAITSQTEKECYVWFELNQRDQLERFLEFHHAYGKDANYVLTARYHNVLEFSSVLNAHGIRHITGFKTSDLLKRSSDFYNTRIWNKVSDRARALSRHSLHGIVLIENEGSVKNLTTSSNPKLNGTRTGDAIVQSEWTSLWVWYGVEGEKPTSRHLTWNLATAFGRIGDKIRFIESSTAGFKKFRDSYPREQNFAETVSIDPDPIAIVYIDQKRLNYWRYQDIRQAINQASSDVVIIYPGARNMTQDLFAVLVDLEQFCSASSRHPTSNTPESSSLGR